jgi:hypothetical protein
MYCGRVAVGISGLIGESFMPWMRRRGQRTPDKLNISGVHNSAIAVGSGNYTVQGSAVVSGPLDESLKTLRAQIAAYAGDQAQAALEQAGILERAAKADPPDITAIARVRGWFQHNLPVILPSLAGVLAHPTIDAVIKAAAEIAAGTEPDATGAG